MSKERGKGPINFNKGTGKFKYQVFFIAAGMGIAYFMVNPFIQYIQQDDKLKEMFIQAAVGFIFICLVLGSVLDSFRTIKYEQIVELNMKRPKRPNWSKLTGASFRKLGSDNNDKITISPMNQASTTALSSGSNTGLLNKPTVATAKPLSTSISSQSGSGLNKADRKYEEDNEYDDIDIDEEDEKDLNEK